ncbi:hypothetical protein PALI_b0499 [Pseudoalteromonas aliena SW19]|uniref:Transposase n=1 Tax=Pseudoalteromonas aliena SW19 TaxID=1314866 RepID=A0ABR9E4Z6_9GAMM|nr:hypothetical protein [Pseudoalteromonas aliena SW19]
MAKHSELQNKQYTSKGFLCPMLVDYLQLFLVCYSSNP